MALFQKQPSYADSKTMYTVGINKNILVVGLGNIGKKYDGTRHNIGFEIIDNLVAGREELRDWQDKKDIKVHLSMGQLADTRVIVIKPTTMMNLSGEAVNLTASFYKIPPSQIVVVHDEIDIEFGQIRTRVGGSSAGHNGIESVIEHIGENFGRVRVGIGPKKPPQIDSADFVLAKFSKEEQAHNKALNKEAVAIVIEYIFSGQALLTDTRSFL